MSEVSSRFAALSPNEVLRHWLFRSLVFRGSTIAIVWSLRLCLGKTAVQGLQYKSRLIRPFLDLLSPFNVGVEVAVIAYRLLALKALSSLSTNSARQPTVDDACHAMSPEKIVLVQRSSFLVFLPETTRKWFLPSILFRAPLIDDEGYEEYSNALDSADGIRLGAWVAFSEELLIGVLRHVKRHRTFTTTSTWKQAIVLAVAEACLRAVQDAIVRFLVRCLPQSCKKTTKRKVFSQIVVAFVVRHLSSTVMVPRINAVIEDRIIRSTPDDLAEPFEDHHAEVMKELAAMPPGDLYLLAHSPASGLWDPYQSNPCRLYLLMLTRQLEAFKSQLSAGKIVRRRNGGQLLATTNRSDGEKCFSCFKTSGFKEAFLEFLCGHLLCSRCGKLYPNDVCAQCLSPVVSLDAASRRASEDRVADYLEQGFRDVIEEGLMPDHLHFVPTHQAYSWAVNVGRLSTRDVHGCPNLIPDPPGLPGKVALEFLRAMDMYPLVVDDPEVQRRNV